MTAVTKKKIIVNSPKLWRPLIDIRDVIQAYEKAIECNSNISGVFNLSGVNYTIGKLGKLIYNKLNEMNLDVSLELLDVKYILNYKVSTDKICDELNFIPNYKPIDTVNEILENIDIETFNFNDNSFYNIQTFKEII